MMHRVRMKIVTRQLPDNEVVFHKAYQYSPDLFQARGIKDVDHHVNLMIAEDINKFKDEFVEFRRASFIVKDVAPEESLFLN